MRTRARLALFLAATLASTGCTGHPRHREQGLRDPIQLPAAPKLEPGTTKTTAPNMNGQTISPLSSSAPAGAGLTR
jgi:hypothetical protein